MEIKMQTLRQEAQAYEPPQTANIADLEVVFIDNPISDKTYTDKEGKSFTIKVMSYNGQDYRVPASVLANLKEILKIKPNLKSFKVTKSGSGLKTVYTVIPLE